MRIPNPRHNGGSRWSEDVDGAYGVSVYSLKALVLLIVNTPGILTDDELDLYWSRHKRPGRKVPRGSGRRS